MSKRNAAQGLECTSNPCLFCNVPIHKAASVVALFGFFLTFGLIIFWLILIGVSEGWAKKSGYNSKEHFNIIIEANRNHHRLSTFKDKMPFMLGIYISGFVLAFLNMITDALLFFLKKHQLVASLLWLVIHILWIIFCISEVILNSIDYQEMVHMPADVQDRRIWKSTQIELGLLIFVYITFSFLDIYFTWVIGVYIRFVREETKRIKSEFGSSSGGDNENVYYLSGVNGGVYVVEVAKSQVDSSRYNGLAARTQDGESNWNTSASRSSRSETAPSYDGAEFSVGSRTPFPSTKSKVVVVDAMI